MSSRPFTPPWRLTLLGLAIAMAGCGEEAAPTEPSVVETEAPAEVARRRGLWVLAEGAVRVLDDATRVPPLIEESLALGATDLFVQVYRGGRAWFDSDRADRGPYEALLAETGVDSLALLLERARATGLRVHAWVNVLSLSQNPRAPLIERLGRDIVLSDRRGRSLLDYPSFEVPQPDRGYYRMGTPGVYLDPAAPGLTEELALTFAELLTRYPTLAGLHLDYIRYPDVLPFAPGSRFGVGLDFGYGAPTRARFEQETGRKAPLGDSLANASAWDAWRRDKLSELVGRIASRARAVAPEILLSAAVWSYADRGYLTLGQDWRGWLEDDRIDFAVPMSYTLDDRLLRYQAEHFAGRPEGARIWAGLGSWLFAKNPERALGQIRIVREAGVVAEVLFSYDSIATAPALRDALVAGAADGG